MTKSAGMPYLVAELSGNHNGCLDRALTLISAAAHAGADAVKFQLYDPAKMTPASLVIESGLWAGRDAKDLYREAQTPREWFPAMIEHAQALGIDWFSSVFDRDGLKFLEALGCPRYKIASFEILDLDLIRAVAATGKPLVISTGMATFEEIEAACDAAFEGSPGPAGVPVTLLKCTSAYPADATDANLATMAAMEERLIWLGPPDVGLSDHTPGIGVAVAAAALGATMIEKHLTLLRADGGPDAAFSMEPDEFAQLVVECRRAAAAIGTVRYGPTESEKPQLQLRGRTMMVSRGMKAQS